VGKVLRRMLRDEERDKVGAAAGAGAATDAEAASRADAEPKAG